MIESVSQLNRHNVTRSRVCGGGETNEVMCNIEYRTGSRVLVSLALDR
jgi:hypothetical protein